MIVAPGILIVEPEPLARAGLEYFLKREGFVVNAAANLAEAMASLNGIDAVFLELNLPDGNGVDVLTHIRAASLPIRVAIMTSAPQASAPAETSACDAYFEKPINRAKLDEMLAWLKALPPGAASP